MSFHEDWLGELASAETESFTVERQATESLDIYSVEDNNGDDNEDEDEDDEETLEEWREKLIIKLGQMMFVSGKRPNRLLRRQGSLKRLYGNRSSKWCVYSYSPHALSGRS